MDRSNLDSRLSSRPSGFRRRSLRRALRFFEKALCRFGSGHRILASRLLWPSPLALAWTLASPRFGLRSRRSLNAVAGRQADFEFDDLVPYGVGALVIGNRQQFPQTATRVRGRGFVAHGLGSRLLGGCGLKRGLFDGLFFVHLYIIARIGHSNPVLPIAPNAMWVFSYGGQV